MWILTYFTCDGEPVTGLSPLVRVRDVETGDIVINSSSMLERGDGFYGYEFSAYNPQKDYAVICDSVTLSGVERYTYASSGEYNEVLDSIESTVGIVDIRTTLLRKIQTNKLELLDGDTDNWTLYDDDTTTPLLTFSVSDKNGDLIVQCPSTPSKRSAASEVSGVLSPDIYMKKSVYDPDEDGYVTYAENVNDGTYTSTASGVKHAVDLAHSPCIHGRQTVVSGSSTVSVGFADLGHTNYTINTILENTIDPLPSMYTFIVSARASSSFTMTFINGVDSDNYVLNWAVIED